MSFGVTPTGFRIKPLENILADIESNQVSDLDPDLNQTSDSVFGQVNKTVSAQIREVWEMAEDVYGSQYPDSAKDASLDSVSSITGTKRDKATKSQVIAVTVNIDNGTLLKGSVAHVAGDTTARFVTKADVTNGGPTPDNFPVDMEAEVTGPIAALVGTLTVIAQPVTGWNSVTNPTDATLGQDADSDAALRLQREQEATASGSANIDAIRADLIQLDNIETALVFENDTDFVDGAGRPPHSVEAIVLEVSVALDDDEIAQAIWDSRAAGITPFSNDGNSGTAVDKLGNDQVQAFTRVTQRAIFVDITLVVDADEYAGDAAVKLAIDTYIDALPILGDVLQAEIIFAALSVVGVINAPATTAFLGFSAAPATTADLPIGSREVAAIDSANITVTVL